MSRAWDKDKKEKSTEARAELRNGKGNLIAEGPGYPCTARGLKTVDRLIVEAMHKHQSFIILRPTLYSVRS